MQSRPTLTLLSFLLLSASTAFAGDPPRAIWVKAKCAVCHGADGAATEQGAKLETPDLRSAASQQRSDEQLTASIVNGKGRMPAFGKALSTAEIRSLVLYVREAPKK